MSACYELCWDKLFQLNRYVIFSSWAWEDMYGMTSIAYPCKNHIHVKMLTDRVLSYLFRHIWYVLWLAISMLPGNHYPTSSCVNNDSWAIIFVLLYADTLKRRFVIILLTLPSILKFDMEYMQYSLEGIYWKWWVQISFSLGSKTNPQEKYSDRQLSKCFPYSVWNWHFNSILGMLMLRPV